MNTIETIPDLNQFGEKWLETKIQRMKNLLKIAYPDEGLYRELMISLGYPNNKNQFLNLSLILPYKEIKQLKEKEIITQALLYRGGFSENCEYLPKNFDLSLRMKKESWTFKNTRPCNFPEKRLYAISYLLYETVNNNGLVNYFFEKIEKEIKPILNQEETKKCVKKIMALSGIGNQRKIEIFFNVILPFTIAFYENQNQEIINFLYKIYNTHPPLSENKITRAFKKVLPSDVEYNSICTSTKTYFGIHLWYLQSSFFK